MKKMWKQIVALTLCLVLVLLVGCGSTKSSSTDTADKSSAAAAEKADDTVYVVKFNSSDPESNGLSIGLKAWAAEVEEASNGRIKFEFYWSNTLAPAADNYTSLLSGAVGGCNPAAGSLSGTWPIIECGYVPNPSANNCVVYSQALTKAYLESEALQKEFEDIKLLCLTGNECYIAISNGKDPSELSAWKGANVRVSGSVLSSWTEQLGSSPVNVAVTETYEAYNKHIVDYVLWNWSGTPSFGLMDDTKYALKDNIGYAVLVFAMNKELYESMPADLQAIIDEKSGNYMAEILSKAWFDAGVESMNTMAEAGIEFVDASDELLDAWHAAATQCREDCIANQEGAGEFFDLLQAGIDEYNKVYDYTTFTQYQEIYGK